jgi:hypothetical protein
LPPAPLRSAYGKLIGNFNPKLSYLLVHNSGAGHDQGQGVLGVIDGASPKGIEGQDDIAWRHDLLRKIGYKR